MSSNSPKVTHFEWGKVKVTGYNKTFKDVKLYPGGARAWDWNETGTEHVPGIQPADVDELIEHGAQVIILSKGVNERLQTMPETLQKLEAADITAHVLQTEKAVEQYNELADQELVGALIHSTC